MQTKHAGRTVAVCVGAVLLAVVVLLVGVIVFLSLTEYRPDAQETLSVAGSVDEKPRANIPFFVMSWNIGYGALGDNADFFMDGGKMVRTADAARVQENLDGVAAQIDFLRPYVVFLQEVDVCSSRSHRIDEFAVLQARMEDFCAVFANNFKVPFLPYPIPPIGKVDSGLATYSRFTTTSAERIQLPVPFSWPIRTANLKRCLLVTRVPVENSDRELVLVNLHLEAYDDGEGKRAQTAMLAQLLSEEAAKGNYVIAGGDFNQTFSTTDASAFPVQQEGNWTASAIDVEQFDGDWQFLMDETTPSCRSLNKPYADADKGAFQYYAIDGFIVSDNVDVELFAAQDFGFVSSDHNPVVLYAILQEM